MLLLCRDLFNIISDLDIETQEISDTIRISPKTKDLSEGRKTFNKLKKKIKNLEVMKKKKEIS